eukprot:scaffold2911_cov73-Skeletonema_marinoi.AAC.5
MSDGNNNDSRQSAEAALLAKELNIYCQSESLSEDGIRQIIEQHGLTHNNNPRVSDYDFFSRACQNKRVTEGIIQCLLEYFPDAARRGTGWSPLYFACSNTNMTLNIVQLLIDAAPDSVGSVARDGRMPLHLYSQCSNKDETTALEILKLLLERHPEAARLTNNDGLPIHLALSASKSPEFCRMLIDAYPGSERIGDVNGALPLHWACLCNTVSTVEYLHKLYPDAIYHADNSHGFYPIHCAIQGLSQRSVPIAVVDIVEYLLNCDPSLKLQKYQGTESLLHFACNLEYTDSAIAAALEIIQLIYDANPEAIEDDEMVSDIYEYHEQVQAFINGELVCARQAKDHHLMTTPDGNGQLLLHTALRSNVRLGSIKLLAKGNPSAIRTFDRRGVIPLHIACQHHKSPSIIKYLVGLDATTLDAVDQEGNTALHLACHCARHKIIALLLDELDAVSVSKRNPQKKLPIDLLWESNAVEVEEDKESNEYVESVFRLLKAYPETLMNIGMQKQVSVSATCQNQSGKKRKFGHEE